MFRVIDRSDTGKTRKLLEECSKNHGLFVCAHPERVFDKCVAYGIDPVNATSYYEYIDTYEKVVIKNVYIDELEKFLKTLSGNNINGYSITIGD